MAKKCESCTSRYRETLQSRMWLQKSGMIQPRTDRRKLQISTEWTYRPASVYLMWAVPSAVAKRCAASRSAVSPAGVGSPRHLLKSAGFQALISGSETNPLNFHRSVRGCVDADICFLVQNFKCFKYAFAAFFVLVATRCSHCCLTRNSENLLYPAIILVVKKLVFSIGKEAVPELSKP